MSQTGQNNSCKQGKETVSECQRPGQNIEDEIVPPHLVKIINILCWLGTCPLTVNSVETEKRFSFRWRSYKILLSLFVAVWVTWNWIMYIANFGLKIHTPGFRESASLQAFERGIRESGKDNPAQVATTIAVLLTAYATIGLGQIHGTFCGWACVRDLEHFLNNWSDFSRKFQQVFKAYAVAERKQIRNTMTGRILKLLSHMWYYLPLIFPVSLNILGYFFNPDNFGFLNFTFVTTTMLSVGSGELFEDIKTCYLFMSVVKAFRMVKLGIESHALSQSVDEATVIRWREIITLVRSQAERLNEYLARRQIVLILEGIVMGTASFYFLGRIDWYLPGHTAIITTWTFMTSSMCARMFIKAIIAEKISKTEADLAKYISLVKATDADTGTLIQLKFTHDVMANSPTVVMYGKYIQFNRSVMLTIFNQVVTYLIVLMQFSQK